MNDLYCTCTDKKTGTFFITTAENRACHILIEDGMVSALSYGRLRGKDVVDVLADIDIERYAFKDGTKMPLAGRAFVDDGYDVLLALNLNPDSTTNVRTKPKRIYRGQVIQDDELSTTKSSSEKASTKTQKKKVRIYRGHILDD